MRNAEQQLLALTVGPRPEHDPQTLLEAVRYFADPDVTHLGVKPQSQGVTSPNGLGEHDGVEDLRLLFRLDGPSLPKVPVPKNIRTRPRR